MRFFKRREVAERGRETREAFEIRIVKGVVSKDYVHILATPPVLAGDDSV